MTWFNKLGKYERDSLHKNIRSCLSISSGVPNCQIHQTQESCVFLACHLPLNGILGCLRLKTSALIPKHWGTLALWEFSISSIHTLMPFRQGAKSWWTGRTPFWGWAQRLWNGAKTWVTWEISRRAATKSTCVSDQRDSNRLFHLGAKMWARISVNPSNIKANGAQIIYPQIEFQFCTVLSHPRSYISELATAVLT